MGVLESQLSFNVLGYLRVWMGYWSLGYQLQLSVI